MKLTWALKHPISIGVTANVFPNSHKFCLIHTRLEFSYCNCELVQTEDVAKMFFECVLVVNELE